jgi:hypothetical protein
MGRNPMMREVRHKFQMMGKQTHDALLVLQYFLNGPLPQYSPSGWLSAKSNVCYFRVIILL